MDYKTLSDDDLIRASEEDVEAFGELYTRHFTDLKGLLQAKFRVSQADAEDIAQKSFIKAQRSLKNFQFRSSFKTWIFSIAKNAAIDLLRSKDHNCLSLEGQKICGTDSEVQFEDENCVPPDQVLSNADTALDLASKIARAKESLSEVQKEIFDLVFVENRDYQEVAKIMGCPVGTVMSRVFFTRQKLEKLKGRISCQS